MGFEESRFDTDDVRMRGFSRRVPVAEVWQWLEEHVSRLEGEKVPVGEAAGRVLAEEIRSPRDVPPFARAMMDGYAVRAADTLGASVYNPIRLVVIGQAFPGRAFSQPVAPGQAVQIMTGAAMPSGADAVLPAELAETEPNSVLALGEVPPGKHVGQIGEDVRQGSVVFRTGRILRPQDVGLLASVGLSEILVVRRPRVRILVTGDELLPAGAAWQPNHIYDANGPMLQALVRRDGGIPEFWGIVADQPEALLAALREPSRSHLPLVSDRPMPQQPPAPPPPGGLQPNALKTSPSASTRPAVSNRLSAFTPTERSESASRAEEAREWLTYCLASREETSELTSEPGSPDLFLISGGSSVGQEDHAPRILAEHGQLVFHGVAMRPSSPAGLGLWKGRLVFLLPGNPVSCLCAYDCFAGRAIRALAGRSMDWPYRRITAPLARKVSSMIGRFDYLRVRLVQGQVEPLGISGASILSSTTQADGFVLIPPESEGYPAGTQVEVFLYDS
ncbi:MAG: molybdopterin molybdotransferase MoeA [Thermoguttaceae bacterium]|nr:molybdopterin molybdotransferase MoeA [Thermoguttaceae bacterium]MDW8037603.1 molybdopterin molybdotransferase MoeA [Thermoguttaceae bacterium]